MGRYTGPACKLCRREKKKLFLKGEKCYSTKCPVERRPYAPGMHGRLQAKISEYGIRLREKQRARYIYGLQEGQFEREFISASRERGVTGDRLIQSLERRLDNVVFRLGLATSRPEARQLVRHRHIEVNGRRVNVPSYKVRVGDKITTLQAPERLLQLAEIFKDRPSPDWLELNIDNREGLVKSLPTAEAVGAQFTPQLIVEYYSR